MNYDDDIMGAMWDLLSWDVSNLPNGIYEPDPLLVVELEHVTIYKDSDDEIRFISR